MGEQKEVVLKGWLPDLPAHQLVLSAGSPSQAEKAPRSETIHILILRHSIAAVRAFRDIIASCTAGCPNGRAPLQWGVYCGWAAST
jgi:hypothetical protein